MSWAGLRTMSAREGLMMIVLVVAIGCEWNSCISLCETASKST